VILHVDVTADDIATGGHDSDTCPIARALLRLDEVAEVYVHQDLITVWPTTCDSGLDGFCRVAKEFIEAFDDGRPVAPFSFDLELEDPGAEEDSSGPEASQ